MLISAQRGGLRVAGGALSVALAALCGAAPALAAEGESLSIFHGGIGNTIITLIIFGIVVYLLGTKAWPQLLHTLEQREQLIRGALEAARREREEAEKLLADYRRQIDRAREEATAIVDEGRRDADAVRRRIQDEARREADEMIARARREIQLAAADAVKDLYDRTAELAVQVAGGILRRELRPEDHRALVTESLQRMEAARGVGPGGLRPPQVN